MKKKCSVSLLLEEMQIKTRKKKNNIIVIELSADLVSSETSFLGLQMATFL